MARLVGGEGGNGLLQWSQSRPYHPVYISRKPRPWVGSFILIMMVSYLTVQMNVVIRFLRRE
jgi:hypothetical protein